jgi:hypothetical protein
MTRRTRWTIDEIVAVLREKGAVDGATVLIDDNGALYAIEDFGWCAQDGAVTLKIDTGRGEDW